MPKVSIIMPVYNAEKYLQEAFQSILFQTFDDFELIIVNDASSDSSPEILHGITDPRVRVVTHEMNKGAAESRNDAISMAQGEYIAIMDADDISLPNRLDSQVRFLDKHPDIALVGCGIYDTIDEEGHILLTSRLPQDNDLIQKTMIERWCFLHPSIMFRREVVERVGLYRKDFEPAEDHDFILRILDHYKAHNLNERIVQYRINPTSLSIVGHNYINELGMVAMRMALKRRQGHDENLQVELAEVKLKRKKNVPGIIMRTLYAWLDSFYTSNRYYGFGCKQLFAGNIKHARHCFIRSLKTNCLFIKSWICLCLSYLPSRAFDTVRFMFRTTKQYYDEYNSDRVE